MAIDKTFRENLFLSFVLRCVVCYTVGGTFYLVMVVYILSYPKKISFLDKSVCSLNVEDILFTS